MPDFTLAQATPLLSYSPRVTLIDAPGCKVTKPAGEPVTLTFPASPQERLNATFSYSDENPPSGTRSKMVNVKIAQEYLDCYGIRQREFAIRINGTATLSRVDGEVSAVSDNADRVKHWTFVNFTQGPGDAPSFVEIFDPVAQTTFLFSVKVEEKHG